MNKSVKDPNKKLKILFIGNSATYVNNIPQKLSFLASKAGYYLETKTIAKGGFKLSQHANSSTEHGKNVFDEISKGYDIVFLQDNGNCISSDVMRTASKDACEVLDSAIRATGAKTYIYVRPPYGYDSFGCTPFEQCVEFDKLFSEISDRLDTQNAYINRAFAYAIKHLNYDLWGPDHAHTGEYGAYLATCVFFSTVFHTTSTVLDPNGLSLKDAYALQKVADKIVFDHWNFSDIES